MHAFTTAIARVHVLLRREGWRHGQNKTSRVCAHTKSRQL